jgi:hypothetical protein
MKRELASIIIGGLLATTTSAADFSWKSKPKPKYVVPQSENYVPHENSIKFYGRPDQRREFGQCTIEEKEDWLNSYAGFPTDRKQWMRQTGYHDASYDFNGDGVPDALSLNITQHVDCNIHNMWRDKETVVQIVDGATNNITLREVVQGGLVSKISYNKERIILTGALHDDSPWEYKLDILE